MKLVVIMFFVQKVTLQEQKGFIYEKQQICADFVLKLKPWGKMTLWGLKLQLKAVSLLNW